MASQREVTIGSAALPEMGSTRVVTRLPRPAAASASTSAPTRVINQSSWIGARLEAKVYRTETTSIY